MLSNAYFLAKFRFDTAENGKIYTQPEYSAGWVSGEARILSTGCCSYSLIMIAETSKKWRLAFVLPSEFITWAFRRSSSPALSKLTSKKWRALFCFAIRVDHIHFQEFSLFCLKTQELITHTFSIVSPPYTLVLFPQFQRCGCPSSTTVLRR